jgi:hypothetical protein
MAIVHKETITITLSRLVKDTADTPDSVISADLLSNLEAVTEELVGPGVIVEANTNQ